MFDVIRITWYNTYILRKRDVTERKNVFRSPQLLPLETLQNRHCWQMRLTRFYGGSEHSH
jgi:hypothetical protein